MFKSPIAKENEMKSFRKTKGKMKLDPAPEGDQRNGKNGPGGCFFLAKLSKTKTPGY